MNKQSYNNGQRVSSTDPYARPESQNENLLETYVPGMYKQSDKQQTTEKEGNQPPVVGFLYSISRNGIGEYWSLHLGMNTIGKSSNNDIQLLEASVSALHANISIKQMKTTGKLIAFIRDVGSKNGIYLNEMELDYEGHPCQNGDVISIGNAYKLLLIIIDAEEAGLSIADNFMAISDDKLKSEASHSPSFGTYERPESNAQMDTMDVNGQNYVEPGETKFM